MHRTLHLASEQLNTSTSQRAARPFGLLQLECAEDLKLLAALLEPIGTRSIDAVLDSLAAAVASLTAKKAEPKVAPQDEAAKAGVAGGKEPVEATLGRQADKVTVDKLVKELASVDFSQVKVGRAIFTGGIAGAKVGTSIQSFAYGRATNNMTYGAFVTLNITGRKGKITTVFVLNSSVLVSPQSAVIDDGSIWIGDRIETRPIRSLADVTRGASQ